MKTSVVSVDQLNAVLTAQRFLQPFGYVVKSCAAGECAVSVPFSPEIERPGGVINGITLMGVADVATWLAIMTLRGLGEHWVTTDLKTAFLRSARQEEVLCKARILKPGRRSMYAVAECYGASSGLVAHHVCTYALVEHL